MKVNAGYCSSRQARGYTFECSTGYLVQFNIREPEEANIVFGFDLLIAISLIVPLVPVEIGDELVPSLSFQNLLSWSTNIPDVVGCESIGATHEPKL